VPLLAVPAVTVITPHELARDLFQWVHDEEVVDALYLQVRAETAAAAAVCQRCNQQNAPSTSNTNLPQIHRWELNAGQQPC
jgi:hypothetical protein